MNINGWKCENCGHIHEATEELVELGFKWLDEDTTKTSCQNCGTYSLQRAYTYDDLGRPIAGYFLVVKTKNRIRKGKK
jgi:uncharacterized Zn finger protein